MKKYDEKTKDIFKSLRKGGKTFAEIRQYFKKEKNMDVPKSSLSYWLKGINLSAAQKRKINESTLKKLEKARKLSIEAKKRTMDEYYKKITRENFHLGSLAKKEDVGKIILAILYLGEGSKGNKGSLTLGNSDEKIIKIFLKLLRKCYKIDEKKFRCTVQCRADQDSGKLKNFWSSATNIPLVQFYKTRIDPRTVGKSSRKKDYKGVCRIDYFSARIYHELMIIGKIISES